MTTSIAPSGATAAVTPGDPVSELNAFNADKGVLAILSDRDHPQHREMQDRRSRLFGAAYPEPGAEGDAAPGASPAADAAPVDHAELLSRFEGGPPAEGLTTEEATAGAEHNRTVVAGALTALGATAEETQRLVREIGNIRTGGVALTTEQAADFMRGVWGPDYDAKIGLAQRALASLKNPALEDWLIETGFGNAPAVIETLHDLGKRKGL